jgi:glycosyltransferase involved in cell wall biosynthesis
MRPHRALRSLATRYHPALDAARVHSWNLRSFLWEARLRQSSGNASNSAQGRFAGFLDVGQRFSSAVRDSLQQRGNIGKNTVFFAYDTGALEAMQWCREQGVHCVLNQMDPSRTEVEIVHEEEGRWPGWATHQSDIPEEYFRRREQEWSAADLVVVNSRFCRDALIKQGVPQEKLFTMPLCYEADESNGQSVARSRQPSEPIRVLFLGQVILRKGIQYLLAAARQLEKVNIQFDVVGPLGISQSAISGAPANVKFHGRAGRADAVKWYRQSDVFVLPTLSDGFAITQLEAMTYGLPVVTTPCCGEVVSEGVDGFIIPPRDADTLAQTLKRYVMEPLLLKSQQMAALAKAGEFTLERLSQNLISLERALVV